MESIIKEIRNLEENKWWQAVLKNLGNSVQIVGETKTMIAQRYADRHPK
ncbi:MAG: TniB family NTP-binding protein [Lactobacillales bacterium]|jgi:hypothetical protein|nr:TniB family NTP-binding protein [Lactobacillales bacterium]